jgi:ferrous iron transport protein B
VSEPEETIVVLVGRPNAGKSSLYNAITGGHAKVGNFPGVTVDVLEATVATDDGQRLRLVDLPGVYSVETEADPESDEGHARRFLAALRAEKKPHVVAQVADATQIGLALRLTAELRRGGDPMVLLATQSDALAASGREIDVGMLEDALGVPVLPVSARAPGVRERVLSALSDAARARAVPPKGDVDVEALGTRAIREHDGDAAARARTRTRRLDAALLHPVLGPVLFVALMALLFACVFLVADPASSVMDATNRFLGGRIGAALGEGWLSSLLVDGVLGGAGTVLAFLPQIVILTVAMELVDASGYLARGSFLVDRLLRAAGLGGRSFVPLLTAHACAVPAIQSTRIIRDPAQRLRTILVLPLMQCSARIPTYGLLVTTFFAGRSVLFKGLVFTSLYFAGIVFGLVASLVLGKTVRRTGRSLPLVLEMPSYRVPQARVVARVAWRAAGRFVRDVGSVIVVASVVLWALLTVPGPGRERAAETAPPDASPRVVAMHGSVAAFVGRELEPVTRPCGFDWRINVGLIGSFGARELMVGTLGVIFGIEDAGDDDAEAPLAERIRDAKSPRGGRAYGVGTGLALMAFFVIACQCMSTVAAIRRETRSLRWPAFVVAYTYASAWLLAVLVYQGARLVGLG